MKLAAATFAISCIIAPALAQTPPQPVPKSDQFPSPVYRGPIARAEDQTGPDPYENMGEYTSATRIDISPTRCSVEFSADYDKFLPNIEVVREGWLNRDYSAEFYRQRGHSVFFYIVLKKLAATITEMTYVKEADQNPDHCEFHVTVSFRDDFGHTQEAPAISWRFTKALADRVDWQHFDDRNFMQVAQDYKFDPIVDKLISGETPLTMGGQEGGGAPPASGESNCDESFISANAVFIHATVECKRDYMDTPAGYYALAASRECVHNGLEESKLTSIGTQAMTNFDNIAKQKGKAAACRWVDGLEKSIEEDVDK